MKCLFLCEIFFQKMRKKVKQRKIMKRRDEVTRFSTSPVEICMGPGRSGVSYRGRRGFTSAGSHLRPLPRILVPAHVMDRRLRPLAPRRATRHERGSRARQRNPPDYRRESAPLTVTRALGSHQTRRKKSSDSYVPTGR